MSNVYAYIYIERERYILNPAYVFEKMMKKERPSDLMSLVSSPRSEPQIPPRLMLRGF